MPLPTRCSIRDGERVRGHKGWRIASSARSQQPRYLRIAEVTSIFESDRTFAQPINWVTTLFMTVFHIGAITAVFVYMESTCPRSDVVVDVR